MNNGGIKGCSQNSVLLTGVRDTDDIVNIGQCKLEQFVHENTTQVRKAEQGMVSECARYSHGSGMQKTLMTEITECLMSMDMINALAYEDIPKPSDISKHGCI